MNAHDHDIVNDIAGTIPSLTDDQAAWLIAAISREHRFVTVTFTPDDVRDYITNALAADSVTREVTDADLNAIMDSWEWRKGMAEFLGSEGMDMVQNAYNDAFDDKGQRRSE